MKSGTYRTTIDGMEVDIFYDYQEGDNGDYWTPPTPYYLEVTGWSFADPFESEKHGDLDDEEWGEVVADLGDYIFKYMADKIAEIENERIAEREQARIERRRRRM